LKTKDSFETKEDGNQSQNKKKFIEYENLIQNSLEELKFNATGNVFKKTLNQIKKVSQ